MPELARHTSTHAAQPRHPAETAASNARAGLAYGVAAFSWWGLITIYFKAVAIVPAVEVLAHRVVFSALLLWAWLCVKRTLRPALEVMRDRRTMLILAGSTCLLSCNWLVFIWAIGHGHVTQASLGYYINPLLNVLLGCVFLGERLRPLQKLSVAFAATGVVILAVHFRQVPTIALVLPATFGLYGLVRKVIHVDSLVGLTVETTLLAPFAGAYLIFCAANGRICLGHISPRIDLLLISAGAVTALPLIWFLNAARRLNLSTLGFLQYIAPTIQLLLGVMVYHEPFTPLHLVSFVFVWVGLILFAVAGLQARARAVSGSEGRGE